MEVRVIVVTVLLSATIVALGWVIAEWIKEWGKMGFSAAYNQAWEEEGKESRFILAGCSCNGGCPVCSLILERVERRVEALLKMWESTM